MTTTLDSCLSLECDVNDAMCCLSDDREELRRCKPTFSVLSCEESSLGVCMAEEDALRRQVPLLMVMRGSAS
eukprot:12950489-Ditylum_brightwellii.AAC.1